MHSPGQSIFRDSRAPDRPTPRKHSQGQGVRLVAQFGKWPVANLQAEIISTSQSIRASGTAPGECVHREIRPKTPRAIKVADEMISHRHKNQEHRSTEKQ